MPVRMKDPSIQAGAARWDFRRLVVAASIALALPQSIRPLAAAHAK